MNTLTSRFGWLALALILSLAVILLAACAGEGPATGTPTAQQPTAVLQTTTPPSQPPLEVGYEEGQKAPNFMMTTVDGEQLTRDSFQGRPVLLYFFATW